LANGQASRQATQAAGAAVPTVGSVNRQYNQSEGDVEGFTKALARILQTGPSPGAGYTSAISQQQGIDSAAANQLAGIGGPFAAGSAAAVGGLGRSALSSLAAQGAAASSYGAKMPGVAAARGQFGVQSLENARHSALQTRQEDYRSAYLQALQQARSNIFNQKMALRQFGLSKQQLAFSESQAAQNNAYRYAALAQNQNQFKSSQAQQFQEYLANLRGKVSSGSAGGLAGFTPSEISQLQKRGAAAADTQVLHGVPLAVAIRNLQAQGVPRSIALAEVQNSYAQATRPTKDEFTSKAGTPQATFNQAGYQAALRAYTTVVKSLQSWVNLRKWRQAQSYGAGRDMPNQPGHGTAP
jgi:chromosome segregation and condensation protein ScpB